MRILVTDAEQRASLAVVRSLARAGHTIFASGHQIDAIAGASRYCHRLVRVPAPGVDPETYVAAIAEIVRQERLDAVVPISEQSNLALLPRRAALGSACVPGPDAEMFYAVCDKEGVMSRARACGIAVPQQHVLRTRHDFADVLHEIDFPVVIKPARSVASGQQTYVRHAGDAQSLEREIAAILDDAFPVLLQRRIVGPGTGVFLLLWNGQLHAAFAHRRLRELPPSGGGSACCVSVPVDAALLAASRRLLDSYRWSGVAMVEYKMDSATGTPYLMEINGRFWGSTQLAVDCGVDFPKLLLDVACRGLVAAPTDYTVGVRLRSWWRDVDHLLARLRFPASHLALPPDAPGRWETLRAFATPRCRQRHETFRWRDPRPFVSDTAEWMRSHGWGRRRDNP